jgi:membrane-associated phospholipid phosphatase
MDLTDSATRKVRRVNKRYSQRRTLSCFRSKELIIPWHHITSLGDSVVTLPAAAIVLAWLVAGKAWRMAFWWSLLFATGLILVLASKVAFIGWGIGSPALDFTGISGHAMRATAVAPVIFYLLLQRSSAPVRWAGILLGIVAGALIGISRVVVDAHSISEVVSGCLLGGALSLIFMWLSRPLPKPSIGRWLIAFSMLALLPTTHAEPAPTEDWMNAVALYLSGRDTPYVRTWGPLARPVRGAENTEQGSKQTTGL